MVMAMCYSLGMIEPSIFRAIDVGGQRPMQIRAGSMKVPRLEPVPKSGQ